MKRRPTGAGNGSAGGGLQLDVGQDGGLALLASNFAGCKRVRVHAVDAVDVRTKVKNDNEVKAVGCYVSTTTRNSLRNSNGRYRVNLGPAHIYGPFERELYYVYLSLWDSLKFDVNEHGLPVKCLPLAVLWSHLQPIVSSWSQLVKALSSIKWAAVKDTIIFFFIDPKNTTDLRDTVVIDEEDLDLIEGLMGFLKNPDYPWLEGCYISHLLDHCTSLKESFHGVGREKRFINWVKKYPVFFSSERYENFTAVKWTGCDLLFDRWR